MSGVRVRFLNRDEIIPRLAERAGELLNRRPEVLEVSLFGSLARDKHAPGSDADLLILLREDSRKFTERVAEFLEHFSGMPLTVEVFPYTAGEVETMQNRSFMKRILNEKMILASRV